MPDSITLADPQTPSEKSASMPLYVDLDGSLFGGDLLWESLLLCARRDPGALLRWPGWLVSGRAAFKAKLAERVCPDVRTLPYRPQVLAYLAAERARGRPIVLATASSETLAHGVAEHLGLFDAVLASGPDRNLKGTLKLEAIRDHAAEHSPTLDAQFEYLGDSRADLPIWRAARLVSLAAAHASIQRTLASEAIPARVISQGPGPGRALLEELRPHQWAKNVLIFVPLLLAHRVDEPALLLPTLLAFLCFCALASASYIANDLLDLEADRRHASKCERPLAAGRISIPSALTISLALLITALGAAALWLPPPACFMLCLYLVLTLGYSAYFKRRLFLDVLLLAGLYTHRVLTGGVASGVELSPWLLAFSTFFFLSLALVKRSVELRAARENGNEHLGRRAYRVSDLELIDGMGLASGYIAVLVLCLFVSSHDVARLYAHPERLWLMCPVMLYWISRIWLLARRGEVDDDPVLFATRDPNSYASGFLIAAVVLVAAC